MTLPKQPDNKLCPIFLRRGWRYQNDQITNFAQYSWDLSEFTQNPHTNLPNILETWVRWPNIWLLFKGWLVVGTPPPAKKKKKKKLPTEDKREKKFRYHSIDNKPVLLVSYPKRHQITGGYQGVTSVLKPWRNHFSVWHVWVCKKSKNRSNNLLWNCWSFAHYFVKNCQLILRGLLKEPNQTSPEVLWFPKISKP